MRGGFEEQDPLLADEGASRAAIVLNGPSLASASNAAFHRTPHPSDAAILNRASAPLKPKTPSMLDLPEFAADTTPPSAQLRSTPARTILIEPPAPTLL